MKNFKTLLDVAGGEDNLAIRLETTLHRIRELASGVSFSDEMTHHVETTLGLRSGFLDQVNPTLSADETQRIRTPDNAAEAANDSPALSVQAELPLAGALPVQAAAVSGSAVGAPNSEVNVAPSPETQAPSSPAASEVTGAGSVEDSSINAKEKAVARPKKTAQPQQAPAAASNAVAPEGDVDAARQIRRMNLVLLTGQKGSKSALGRLMDLSPANISHRLHGNKHFDHQDALSFAQRLKLPDDWFEVPRTEADIPAETLALLGGEGTPGALRPAAAPAAKKAARAPRAARSAAAQPTALKQPKGTKAVSAPAASLKQALTMTRTTPPPAPTAVSAAAPSVTRSAPVKPTTAGSSSTPAQAAASMVHVLDGMGEVGPIAEALVKTLAALARQGKLTEKSALKMLMEVTEQ